MDENNYQNPTNPTPPQQPMNPATKKKILIFSIIGGAVLILGIAAAIIIPALLKIDYAQTYQTARAADDANDNFNGYDSCFGVLYYADSPYTSKKDYTDSVEACRSSIENYKQTIATLGAESAVKRDSEIKTEWEKFKPVFDRTIPLYEQMLAIYPAWHDFTVNASELLNTREITESEIAAAVQPLVDSGNERLKSYGEGWLEKTWAAISTYQAYYNAKYNDPNYSALRTTYQEANAALEEYKEQNKPDMTSSKDLLGVDLTNSDYEVSEYFSDLYSAIYKKYQLQNYSSLLGQ